MQRAIGAVCSAEIMQAPIEPWPEQTVQLSKAFQSLQRKVIKEMGRKSSKPEVAGMNWSAECSRSRAASHTSLVSDHGEKLVCLVGC